MSIKKYRGSGETLTFGPVLTVNSDASISVWLLLARTRITRNYIGFASVTTPGFWDFSPDLGPYSSCFVHSVAIVGLLACVRQVIGR